jgi:hypothetical protein
MRKQSIVAVFGAAVFGAASLLLSGCTVGPKYKRPTIDAPTVYRGAEANGNTQTSKAPHDLDGTPLPGRTLRPPLRFRSATRSGGRSLAIRHCRS